ncbi:MAG: type II toxin-antitoxin system HicA family toxin [bacterium]
MSRLPRLTARQAIHLAESAGFHFARQSGSHAIYRNREGRRVTIPIHAGRVLHPKIVKALLEDLRISGTTRGG